MNSVGNKRIPLGRAQATRTSGLPKVQAALGTASKAGMVFHGGRAEREAGRELHPVGGGTVGSRTAHRPFEWKQAGEGGQAPLHLLVLDEDAEVRQASAEIGRRMGFVCEEAASVAAAHAVLRNQKVDLLLMDLRLEGRVSGGMPLLEEVKRLHPDATVIVMALESTEVAMEAMRLGAEDYLIKPFAMQDLVNRLERTSRRTQRNAESQKLRELLRQQQGSGPLIGHSPEMEKLYRILSKVAHSTHPVLIVGETGTGKELVGRSIHFNGSQAAKPFVPVDCGRVSAALLEGELFGWAKGFNPGRNSGSGSSAREGLLASPEGGTVYLDEVGELPLDLQTKLLRVLQDKVVQPLGATQTVPLVARILASTSVDLGAMVEQGRFRRDLYYRLNVVTLRIPPLRQRREDIAELAQFFLERMQREMDKMFALSSEALQVLISYDWPGNVEELEMAIQRACSTASGAILRIFDFPSPIQLEAQRMKAEAELEGVEAEGLRLRSQDKIQSIAELERNAILVTIRQLRGDKLMAAKLLGIGKTTLYRKLKEYGLTEAEGAF